MRPGGIGALARAAARLNDHAEDLAERLGALPAELRARAIGMMQATVAERRPLRLRLSDINDIRLPLFFFSVSTEIAADRKSTRLNSVTNAHLVCRLLLEKKNNSMTQL